MLKRTLVAIAGLTLAFSLITSDVALAGRPGGGGSSSSSITLVVLADGQPAGPDVGARYGDQVTFNVTTDASNPFVNLKCYQNGVLVAEGWEGFFEGALGDRIFTLWSPQWVSGAADCTASVSVYSKRRWTSLASVAFHVSP